MAATSQHDATPSDTPDAQDDRAKLPPAVPMFIDPDAAPLSAHELAEDSGDAGAQGDLLADPPRDEIAVERGAAGADEPDGAHPASLLPPD